MEFSISDDDTDMTALIAEMDPRDRYLYAVVFKDLALIREVLDSGMPVDAPIFGHGATALVFATDDEVIRLLLERGASPNSQDWEEVTALGKAISGNLTERVRLLLEYGAGPMRRIRGGTFVELAEQIGNEEVVALLKAAAAPCP